MYLKQDDLWIRTATLEDAHQLCIWWNDGKVMAHAGFTKGLNTTVDKIQHQLSFPGKSHRMMIGYKEYTIGEMSYNEVDDITAEIGIKICDFAYQNQGNGTKLLKMLLGYLKEIGYKKVILDTNFNNQRARHVYTKLGFKEVAINKDAWLNDLNEPQTSVDYELIL